MNDRKSSLVLVIDDEPAIRSSIRLFLEDNDFEVVEAENGRIGVELFDEKQPDLVLVDLRMPELDGYGVIDHVREKSPDTPLIVVSGTGHLRDAVEAVRRGAWDYFLKPIHDMGVLMHAVERALERGRLIKENFRYQQALEELVEERTAELLEANRSLQAEIEERKNTEKQLRHAQKMEAIGTLAGGIAHDFNNILSAVYGYTELAMRAMQDNKPAAQKLKEVLNAANRARDLVKQILSISREAEQERKPVILAPIIKEAIKLLRSSLPSNIEIKQHINTNSGTVLADPTQVHQVIMNLCVNARDSMKGIGGTLSISLSESPPPTEECVSGKGECNYLKVSVSDKGVGIPAHIKEHIFEPYFSTKKKEEGTGLGLSVVHGIVKNHDGEITVTSTEGVGTTFDIYLPKLESPKEEEPEQKAESVEGNETILFVDDEVSIVEIAKMSLGNLGYGVVGKTDADEALATFQRFPESFDLVITDHMMPKMTGEQLAQKVLKIRPDIPVILCTGFTTTFTEERLKSVGIRRIASKPLREHEMARLIREVMDEKNNQ